MPTLADLVPAVRASWGADTCDESDLPWDPANPGRGQCGVSALVVNDHLGGVLVCCEVLVDGARVGYHWWNRLPDGCDVDLTRDQFLPEERLTPGEVRVRDFDEPRRGLQEYRLLAGRVRAHLDAGRVTAAARSVGAPNAAQARAGR